MAEADEHFRLGVEAYKAGNYDKAIEELETATELNHEDHKAFTYLGAAYAAKGRYNAAIGAFKTAEQIMPGIASIHYNIAQAYEAAGIPTEAEYEYERALQIDPNYTKARDAYERLKRRLKHI
jgi:tetratricopeptide (TPR) repeat protein